MKAEEYAKEVHAIIGGDLKEIGGTMKPRELKGIEELFQAALDAPPELVDEKPKEEGYYWWKHSWSKKRHLLKVFPQKDQVFLDGKLLNFADMLASGRFSHRLKKPGGE